VIEECDLDAFTLSAGSVLFAGSGFQLIRSQAIGKGDDGWEVAERVTSFQLTRSQAIGKVVALFSSPGSGDSYDVSN